MLRAPRKSKSKSPYARPSGQAAAAVSTAVRTMPRTQAAITRTRPQGTTATSTVSTATLPQVATIATGIPVNSVMEQAIQTQQDMVNEQGTGSTANPGVIWIIGSSIVHWAHSYAVKSNQSDLGLGQTKILWHGIRGMVWEQLNPTLDFLLVSNRTPDIIIIHCGGNNIGQQHNTLRGIQMMIKANLAKIKERLPNCIIIWSHILQRRNWSNVVANTEGEKCRRRINSSVASFVLNKLNGAAIKYPDITANQRNLFRSDGVHMTDLGNDLFINTVKGALKRFLSCKFQNRTFP
ncbi:uncharacterized protein LOC134270354 isoform X1 [Saccostrea cucullata]|uniref:uncharacterized protein LOC134270354 isoform X1 n=1 Tax=Saccostrea cuccullata TaxID=36930 RepID=UPI002ED214FC